MLKDPNVLASLRPFSRLFTANPTRLSRRLALMRHNYLLEELPERLQYIAEVLAAGAVRYSGNDRSYLDAAGQWLAMRAGMIDSNQALGKAERMVEPLTYFDQPTLSACHYVAYLFASRLLESRPWCRYELCLQVGEPYYHETVLRSLDGRTLLEPVSVTKDFVWSVADGYSPDQGLGVRFEQWQSVFRGEG